MFIWQRPEWPQFRQDDARLGRLLADTRHAQGRLLGRMGALGFEMRSEATLRMLTEDVVKTSEIEGEILAPDQVRSSLASRLGLDAGGLPAPDREVDGVVEMTLDATRNYAVPLTEERLFSWHAALFPTGYSGMQPDPRRSVARRRRRTDAGRLGPDRPPARSLQRSAGRAPRG